MDPFRLFALTASAIVCLGFIVWYLPEVTEFIQQRSCPHTETIRKHDRKRTWVECLHCGLESPGIVNRIGRAMVRVCMYCKDHFGVKCYTCGSTDLQQRTPNLYFCLKCEVLVRVDPGLETHGACKECHAVQMAHLHAENAELEEVRA